MAHDDQFTATGPSLAGSGFPRSAFSSKATGMVYGVNVQGDKAGIYAESVSAQTDRESHLPHGIGVYGVGDLFGVFGRVHRASGNAGLAAVAGQHQDGGVAMIGVALSRPNRAGTGVAGISHDNTNPPVFQTLPDPAAGSGTGVYGSSGSGPGVRGTSASGAGVVGESESAAGVRGTSADGAGVVGESQTAAGIRATGRVGVRGQGSAGPGGEFTSADQHAQLHLVPHPTGGSPTTRPIAPREHRIPGSQLPTEGHLGDLLLTQHDDAVECLLWGVC
jgi:hypothetical protein